MGSGSKSDMALDDVWLRPWTVCGEYLQGFIICRYCLFCLVLVNQHQLSKSLNGKMK